MMSDENLDDLVNEENEESKAQHFRMAMEQFKENYAGIVDHLDPETSKLLLIPEIMSTNDPDEMEKLLTEKGLHNDPDDFEKAMQTFAALMVALKDVGQKETRLTMQLTLTYSDDPMGEKMPLRYLTGMKVGYKIRSLEKKEENNDG